MVPNDLQRFFPAAQFGELRDVVPLTMGQSGSNVYSVTAETGEYILRIHGEHSGSWKNVILMQRVASENGIAPPLVYIDDFAQAAVSVKVSGVSFGAAFSQQTTRAAALGSLVDVLTKLHAIAMDRFKAIDPIHFARSVWDEQVQRQSFPSGRSRLEAESQKRTSCLNKTIEESSVIATSIRATLSGTGIGYGWSTGNGPALPIHISTWQ